MLYEVITVAELKRDYPLHEIAVLFRAGYQSYPVELELNKLGIPFQKYGGIRFTEAAHIKDVLGYLRLAVNPADLAAWRRVLEHVKGVGAKTSLSIAQAAITGDAAALKKHTLKRPLLADILRLVEGLRNDRPEPKAALERVVQFYTPLLIEARITSYNVCYTKLLRSRPWARSPCIPPRAASPSPSTARSSTSWS